MSLKQHPLSAAFPAMPADDFAALKDSIGNIGVQNPITLFEGMVLDGWHRYTAANELGMDCPVVELGDVDPRDFVKAVNDARRHMTQSARALALTAVYAWNPVGNPSFAQSNVERSIAKTTAELAKIAGVGVQTIREAKTVHKSAAPEVVAAVKSGEIGLPKAAAIAKLPKEEQAAAITKPTPKPAKQEAEDVTYAGPSQSEIDAAMAGVEQDIELLNKLLESDDKLAALMTENNKLRAELAVVKLSRDGYMNRSSELIGRIKSLKKKLEKLEAANV